MVFYFLRIAAIVQLVVSTIAVVDCATTSKICDNKKFDENILKINGYSYHKNHEHPKSINDLPKYCSQVKEGEEYLKQYIAQKCVSGSSKTIISVYLYTSARVNKKYCSSKASLKTRTEMFNMGNCVNAHKKVLKECMKSYISNINLTHSIQNESKKIPYICCLAVQIKNCYMDVLTKTHDPKCPDKVIDDVGNSIEQQGGNAVNTFCTENPDGSDKCAAILKLPTKKPVPLPDPTPFRVLLRVFETL